MGAGIKVGLRVPWLYFVARTIRLDEAFVVRRGVPALCVDIENEGSLRRVLVSTPEAGASRRSGCSRRGARRPPEPECCSRGSTAHTAVARR